MAREHSTDSHTLTTASSVNAESSATTTPAFRATPPTFADRCGACFRWLIAALACVWISWCTSIGPLMRSDIGLAGFDWTNALLFLVMFSCTFGFVLLLVFTARRREGMCRPRNLTRVRTRPLDTDPAADLSTSVSTTSASSTDSIHNPVDTHVDDHNDSSTAAVHSTASSSTSPAIHTRRNASADDSRSGSPDTARSRLRPRCSRIGAAASRAIIAATSDWKRIWLVLAICWLWVPTTLLAAFGADVYSQAREFAWAWNQWTGVDQPYIGFFSFVPMDIYPTAHYMWPEQPTYLTDQHNIVLTVFYGGALAISRYLTGSNDAGLVVLAVLQWLFAGFCCASAANRFFNLPWLTRRSRGRDKADGSSLIASAATTVSTRITPYSGTPAGACARALIMLVFICCPLVLFATISLTKSPLFAFAFTWWFGLMYELYMTYVPRIKASGSHPATVPAATDKPASAAGASIAAAGQQVGAANPSFALLPTRRITIVALVVSVSVMLISAKYAWYILLAQVVFSLLADRRRWKLYLGALLLPTILIHGSIAALIASGTIISGDPIESRGIQIQMIARVAHENPNAIPQDARDKLAPIFNLDQTAQAYRPQDADPVKSSGIQSKKVSYRWRSVTSEDMDNFNKAWLEIVRADPRTAFDGLFAKSYGYFDIFDPPYVPMSYYIDNDYVQQTNTWIKYYDHDWRTKVADFARGWSGIPVLGWFTHGNFYVTLTLLIGAAELALKRWRALSWHMPLLLLMGVMITAPANNFERHMLPIAFVFGFLCLMFHRDTRRRLDVPALPSSAH
ncbi:hypothetical protein B1400_1197 [Bifidobacterium italicum]|uniref:Beta-carotene 15,15'-monooxygenase n=1 Tax=Bifidobacterium italicum TaxID=1960968 RepID=A0A2A2EIM4_9BIFI|nr:DUF6020 family protein [Bifidobacterium italicum]PAU69094.1 hypothetical protein B1400_1197 [Bifidobacterium italicum]